MTPHDSPPAGDPDLPLEVADAAQLKAMAHPLRNRVLFALGPEGATVSQLATRLRTNKGNVAHHLAVLERAGLARRGRTRTVRGGTEQYWERAARKMKRGGRGCLGAHDIGKVAHSDGARRAGLRVTVTL